MSTTVPPVRKCDKCGNVASFASTAGGQPRCPRCDRVFPDAGSTERFEVEEHANLHPRPLAGLGLGITASVVLHLILISMLSLLVLEPRVLNLALIVSLLPETDEAEAALLDLPIDLSETSADSAESLPFQATESLSGQGTPGTFAVGTPPGLGAGQGNTGIAVAEPMAGFSSVAAGRLKKHAVAKRGDYEIALFWDGPSDLDLHVYYRSPTGTTRYINFAHPGGPMTGFLDLDQNADVPYTSEPIEHIRWNTKKPPVGYYQVGVHGFELRSEGVRVPQEVAFTVEIKTPDGVKSYSGSVRPFEFEEVDTVSIGISAAQQQTAEAQAERLLVTAQEQLGHGETRAQRAAQGLLKTIVRKYPKTKASQDAQNLLRGLE